MRPARLVVAVALVAVTLVAAVAARAATVTGTDGGDVLIGTPQTDTLSGGPGNDQLRGGGGDDVLDGGPGSDDLAGGGGIDAAVYPEAGPVVVTLDDLANDGPAGEQDNVQSDIEDVYGGAAADRLTGSAGENLLDGGGGDDVIDGGAGEDELFGGAGDDRLQARDGRRDSVDCGPGDDVAVVDTLDATRGCELIDRRPVAPRADGGIRWTADVGATTTYSELVLTDVHPSTASVTLVCHGGGCPFAKRSLGTRRQVGHALSGARLRPGSRIELWLTAKGRVGKVLRLLTRRAEAPRRVDLCLVRQHPSPHCPQ